MLIENPEDIALDIVETIFEAAALPASEPLLVLGDPDLPDCLQGLTVPRQLVDVLALSSSVGGLLHRLDQPWDFGVLISSKWAVRQPTYPAYFAYLVGHELGHAVTALKNIEHFVFEGLIVTDLAAVSGRSWRGTDMPHEIRYDQFGLAIAAQLHGREALDAEITQLLGSGLGGSEARLRKMLTLEPCLDLASVAQELADFASPYKDAFLEKWSTDQQNGLIGLIQFLPEPAVLWEIQ